MNTTAHLISDATSGVTLEQRYPSPEEVNKNRLLDACIEAIESHGLQHLQMNHVIDGSGLSRGTAYKYFKNKTAVVHAAYLREGAKLFEGAKQAVLACTTVEDIFVYSFLYVHSNLPKNPLLREVIYNHQELLESLAVEQTILETLKGFDLKVLFGDYPAFCDDIQVVSGYWIHAIISFLLLRSGEGKSLEEIEQYVRKRFVPGLCLQEYGIDN